MKYRYISRLFNASDLHIKSQNHCVSILQSIELQQITKNTKWELKRLKQVLFKKV